MLKIGVITLNKFNQLINVPSVIEQTDWHNKEKGSKSYKAITAFEEYFTPEFSSQFDFIFNSIEDFEKWAKLPVSITDVKYDWVHSTVSIHCDNGSVYQFPSGDESWSPERCLEELNQLDETDFSFKIPSNPIVEYDLQSVCPIDSEIVRKAYWLGRIEATPDYFRIFTPILHFKNEVRIQKYDTEVYTQVDRDTEIENPFNPGQMVNEYEFFMNITSTSVLITDAVRMGMQKADLNGTFNKRVNYEL
jgi:hypothetical protein